MLKLWSALMVSLVLACPLLRADEGLEVSVPERDTPVSFEDEIEPLLRKNCLACHNKSETEGELVMETVESLLEGGDSGPAIIPGDSEESLLFQVASHSTEPIMPPVDNDVGAKPLSARALGLLKLWIDEGAQAGDESTGPAIQWKRVPAAYAPVYAMDISADGRWLAAGRGNQLVVYSVPGKHEVQRLADAAIADTHADCAHLDIVQAVAWSPDGRTLVSGGYRCIKVWQRSDNKTDADAAQAEESGSKLDRAILGDIEDVVDFSVSQDKTRLVVLVETDDAAVLRLHELPSRKLLREWKADVLSLEQLGYRQRRVDLAKQRLEVAKADVEAARKQKADEENLAKKNEADLKKAEEEVPKAKEVHEKAAMTADQRRGEQKTAREKAKSEKAEIAKKDAEIAAAGTDEEKQTLKKERDVLAASLRETEKLIVAKKKEVEAADAAAKKKRLEFEGKEKVVTLTRSAIERGQKAIARRADDLAAAEQDKDAFADVVKQRMTELESEKAQSGEAGNSFAEIAPSPFEWAFAVTTSAGERITFALTDGELVDVAPASSSGEWKLVATIGDPDDASLFADRVTSLAFNRDGTRLATGGGDPSRTGEVHVWDTGDWTLVSSTKDAHSDVVYDLQFSPQDDVLASCGSDRMMKTIDVASGKPIRNFEGHTGHVLGVSWRANGRTLATAGADKVVKVWDAVDGTQKKTVSGFRSEVTAVRFVGLEDRFVFSTGDGKVESRDSAGNGKPGFSGFADYVHRVVSNRDGDRIAAAGQDQVIRIWDAKGKLIVSFK